MKTRSNVFYVLRISLTLLLITSVTAALLAGVNMLTKDRIAAITKEKTEKAIAEVLPNAAQIEDISHTATLPETVSKVYAACENGSPTGDYAVEVTPAGFDGEITMMVGVDGAGKVIAISIINQTETAGLGAVAAESGSKGQAFRNQFAGMSGTLAVDKDGGDIDALTGATITSRAITDGVNTALECVKTLQGG